MLSRYLEYVMYVQVHIWMPNHKGGEFYDGLESECIIVYFNDFPIA